MEFCFQLSLLHTLHGCFIYLFIYLCAQESSQTWCLCSLTRWARLYANARSTLWRGWVKDAAINCCFTSARQTKPAGRQTDRSVFMCKHLKTTGEKSILIVVVVFVCFLNTVLSAESHDADCPGIMPPSRSQQMRFWNADNIHPQPTEGKCDWT